MKRIAIFCSGNGTNMENLIKETQAGRIKAEIVFVLCDREGAGAVHRAEALNVPAVTLDRKKYPSKAYFETDIIRHLEEKQIDYIVLAGFMRILSRAFVEKYWGRIINIHPSYLPEFPGASGIQDAFAAKASQTGVTVHFVDTGVDTGPIILQRRIPVLPDDTLESLEERVHALEYEIYPEGLRRVLADEVSMPPRPRELS